MDPTDDEPGGRTRAAQEEVTRFLRVAAEYRLELKALDVWKRIGALETLTGWDDATVRRQIGCDLAAFAEVGPDRALRSLELSAAYLEWMHDLIAELGAMPAPHTTRRLVLAARSLFDSAGGERDAARLARCRAALARADGVPFRPRDYLELGEVGRAFDVAAVQLLGSQAAVRAALVEDARAAFERTEPHVHPDRLALIGTTEGVQALGPGVHAAIVRHLQSGCAACNAAAPVPTASRHSIAA